MEVYVKVYSNDLLSGTSTLTTESFLTMVAVDQNGKPIPVPKVIPQTEEEKNDCLKQPLLVRSIEKNRAMIR
ncbi:hypothetical protein GCM10020331_086460 [Ectobacillus funiculus]